MNYRVEDRTKLNQRKPRTRRFGPLHHLTDVIFVVCIVCLSITINSEHFVFVIAKSNMFNDTMSQWTWATHARGVEGWGSKAVHRAGVQCITMAQDPYMAFTLTSNQPIIEPIIHLAAKHKSSRIK